MTLAALLGLATSPGADAQEDAEPTVVVDVLKVNGWLDPLLVDFVAQSIEASADDDVLAVVLQLDSPGDLVDDEDMDELVAVVEAAPVVIGVWVGPSGAQAARGASRLVDEADFVGVAPGSTVVIGGRRIGATEADRDGVADFAAPTLGDFIVNLPGVDVREIEQGDETRRVLADNTQVRFSQLPLLDRLFHTAASPAVAYLLLVIGLALILFEFFTAGVGVAGVVGAGSLALSCYGLAVLPTTPWGIALLLLGMFGFGVDVQTGVPRFWTAVGTAAFLLGSLTLYDGISLSWITLLVAVVGMVIAMLGGMPAMVRARFSTPTIGRDWMTGEQGEAFTAIAPDGVVLVRDAPWRARTNRATPIPPGDPVRVAAIDGLVLEVEPLEGAAKDYRDRH